ncbi:permease prefix domain 1-containing protein [Thermomonospora umbrina]|uniref:Uncharacterized protein n=1 Tax=Thermomonospora umbrina TaxID=111806 RepID=A0A3D9SYH2_9ACTN|nr:permease prefix domain 1-containing protein [Thermomonospora umbrina]REE97614.1 hypothetical protein DFJ69_3087 [Thermomonospora umbrina]
MTIDAYVAELRRAIVGPSRLKRDMVVEARDGLEDAAEALRAEGVPAAEAERLAVVAFGTVREVAPGYQEELTASAGRRLGLLLAVAGPMTWVIWWATWRLFPVEIGAWGEHPGWAPVVDAMLDGLHLFSGVLGVLIVAALTRRGRRWSVGRTRLVARLAGAYVSLLVVLTFVLVLPLLSLGDTGADGYRNTPWTVATAASAVLMGLQVRGARRCLRLSRLPTA